MDDDLVDPGVVRGRGLPGQERLGDDQQRIGQVRGGYRPRPRPGGLPGGRGPGRRLGGGRLRGNGIYLFQIPYGLGVLQGRALESNENPSLCFPVIW